MTGLAGFFFLFLGAGIAGHFLLTPETSVSGIFLSAMSVALLLPIGRGILATVIPVEKAKTRPWAMAALSLIIGAWTVGVAALAMAPHLGIDTIRVSIVIAGIVLAWRGSLCGWFPVWREVLPDLLIVLSITIVFYSISMDSTTAIQADGRFIFGHSVNDQYYYTAIEHILRTGNLGENPFYAGYPVLFHHYNGIFLVAALPVSGLTFDGIVDLRGVTLTAFSLPLVLLSAFTAFRMVCGRRVVAGLLTLLMCLPITVNIVPKAYWSLLMGSNGFWNGIIGDINYGLGIATVFGVLSLLCLVIQEDQWSWTRLGAIGLMIGVAAFHKVNFFITTLPAVCLALAWHYWRRRIWLPPTVVAAGCLVGIALVSAATMELSAPFAMRNFGWDYGLFIAKKVAPIFQSEPANWFVHGLTQILWFVPDLPAILQPPTFAIMFAVAYWPPVILALALPLLWRGRSVSAVEIFISAMAWCYVIGFSGLVELSQFEWNLAGPLHFLLPIVGLAAIAALISVPRALDRWAALAGIAALAVCGAVNWREFGDPFFAPGITADEVSSADEVAAARFVDAHASRDAVLVLLVGKLSLDAIARRPMAVAPIFAYPYLYPDYRQRVEWIGAVASSADPSSLSTPTVLAGRELAIIATRKEMGERATTCFNDICVRLIPGVATRRG